MTDTGKSQCAKLQAEFLLHNLIDTVNPSPLRRAVQTAVLSFGPTIARRDVPFLLLPTAQEVSSKTCDVGFAHDELEVEIPKLFAGLDLPFDIKKIDYSAVVEGWNSKEGFWAPPKDAVQERAAALRAWFYARPEKHILLVTHGAFLDYLTEDWTGDDLKRGTAYFNCEVRQFTFTPSSDEKEAHIMETEEEKAFRKNNSTEADSTILAELAAVKK